MAVDAVDVGIDCLDCGVVHRNQTCTSFGVTHPQLLSVTVEIGTVEGETFGEP